MAIRRITRPWNVECQCAAQIRDNCELFSLFYSHARAMTDKYAMD